MRTIRQLKLAIDPGPQHSHVPLPEWSVQKTIEDGLTHLGYIVLHTQHQYALQTCANCGCRFRPTGGYGASEAIPDLLVRLPSWPVGQWIGIECKGTKTRLSPEQKLLTKQGGLLICRCWEDCIELMRLEIE